VSSERISDASSTLHEALPRTRGRRTSIRSRSISRAGWHLINSLQALFTALWTALWVTLALIALVLTRSRRVPLNLARLFWGPGLLAGAGARLIVHGRQNLAALGGGSAAFIANHTSMIDVPVIFTAIPANLRILVKRELRAVPFIGWYARAMGMIFVDRKRRYDAIRSIEAGVATLPPGVSLFAFPEGTRSCDGRIASFKKGIFMLALQAEMPIVPCAILGAREVLPRGGFRVRPGTIHFAFGAPIPTAGMSEGDRDHLAQLAQERLIDLQLALEGLASPLRNSST
jgi:1-acyl-sn-glycerol-3-phosphate acyltransferase